jgi:metal-sulfur cluster biosynthetic enzyme
MEIKVNDVYRFRYNEETKKKMFDSSWSFDGQLIVKEKNESLYLEDTYWNSSNVIFTLEEILEKGTLTFVCNLDEVKEIREYDIQYYDDKDIFDLSYQHHCYIKYYIKNDTKRSIEKMRTILNEKIAKSKFEIAWETTQIKRNEEKLKELENGNLDIYI